MRMVEYSAKDVSKFWMSMWALWLLMLSACGSPYQDDFRGAMYEYAAVPSKVGNK